MDIYYRRDVIGEVLKLKARLTARALRKRKDETSRTPGHPLAGCGCSG